MSLTKKGYGSQLRKLLYPDTTPDAKFSIQQAMLAFCQARDEYVKINILRNKTETHIVPSVWLSPFEDVAIQQDASGRYYTTLPAKTIATPRDIGVYHLWRTGCDDQLMVPVTPGFTGMYRNSAARGLEGEQGYYIQGSRIIYIQQMDVNKTVSMRLIAQSADLREYDYFPIDDSCLPEILRRALELYSVQKNIPPDTSNDGISD